MIKSKYLDPVSAEKYYKNEVIKGVKMNTDSVPVTIEQTVKIVGKRISELSGIASSSVKSRFGNLYNNKKFCDVTIKVGNKEKHFETATFYANRAILACQSNIFGTLLYSKLFAESAANSTVVIEDVSPAAFDFLLQLFYLMDPNMTHSNCIDILYACEKYMLTDLKQACFDYIGRYMLSKANSLIDTVVQLKKNGLFDFIRAQGFMQNLPKFDKSECKLLLLNPNILYFDTEMIEEIIFKSGLLSNRKRSVIKISMENQWNFIDRWAKFQIILENKRREEEAKAAAKAKEEKENATIEDDEKKSDEKENITSLDDDDDDNDTVQVNSNGDISGIGGISGINTIQNYDEFKDAGVSLISQSLGDFETNNMGGYGDRKDNVDEIDVWLINRQIETLDMKDKNIQIVWAQKMLKFVKYVDFKQMDQVFFACEVWPKIEIISQVTDQPLAQDLIQKTTIKNNMIDGWFKN